MAETPEKVLSDVKAGNYAPVYFLQGEESFYIDQIADYIEDNALDETQKGFNLMVMYGKDVDMNQVIQNAKRFPMMSERQVVIVKEAQDIKDLKKESGAKMLEDYVKNPLPSTILVFCHKYKALDARKTISKTLDKHAVVVTTKKVYDNQIPSWIESYVKSKGYKASQKAVVMLAESIGNNLERVGNEVDKIILNAGENKEIDEEMVHKYVGISKEYNVFELQKALGAKDVYKANQIVNFFEANPKNNPIIPIISLLFQYFSKVMVVHQAKDKSERALAGVLKVNPYFIKDYVNAARVYPLTKVLSIIHFISEADLQSKGINSVNKNEGAILKELVFKILH